MAGAQKRQRKKERRDLRREEEARSYKARRRKRLAINLGVLAVGGAVAGLLLFNRTEQQAASCTTTKPETGDTSPVSEPPSLSIDTSKTYTAMIETSCGTIAVDLADDTQPQTVNSFVFLARRGFFDGLTFHRIVKGFVVQGGDPKGDGGGGPGYSVTEPVPPDTKYAKGAVAMAKTGAEAPGTSGSQFFIASGTQAETALTPDYAVLGRVTSGLDAVGRIEATPTGTGAKQESPIRPVYISKVTIREN